MQRWIIGTAAMAALAGCWRGPRSVADSDPADKIPAIKSAVQNGNHRAVPQLVKDLESDDPAVRFYAIEGLSRLTGKDFGYRFYADDDERKPAVETWKQWLAKQPRR